ncbi:hypothetical protein TWF696_005332 [Orbilia brochopaga]|uniref:Uncharacterized protein n=1 Tax=Orbilia brochopaga TaxID=3140254 RepID=A0AAV9V3R4_9PEZI
MATRSSASRQSGQSRRTNPRNQQFDHDVFEGLPIRRWDKKWLWFAKKNTPPPPPPELPLPKDTHLLTPMSQTLLKAARNGTLGQLQEGEKVSTTRLFLTNKWTVIPREDEPAEPEYLGRPPDTYSQHSRLVRKQVNGKVLIVEEEIEDVYIEPTAVANGTPVADAAQSSSKKRAPPPKRKAGRGRKPGFKKMVTFSEDGRALPTGEGRATPNPVPQNATIAEGEAEDDVEMGDAEEGTPDDLENSNDGEGSAEPEKEQEVAPEPKLEKTVIAEVVAEQEKREATVEPMAIVSPTPAPPSPVALDIASPIAPVAIPIASPTVSPAALPIVSTGISPVGAATASPAVSSVAPIPKPVEIVEEVKAKSPSPPAPAVTAEPEVAEPTVVEPTVAEPMIAEPTTAQPAIAEPVVAELAIVEPATTEPAATEQPEVLVEPTPSKEETTAKVPTPIPSPAPVAAVTTPAAKSPSPVEVPAALPVEVPVGAPIEAPVEAPVEVPVEAPVEAPAELPVDVPMEIPAEILDEVMMETPVEAPPPAASREKSATPDINPLKRKSPFDEDDGQLVDEGLDKHEVSISLALAERESHDETLTPIGLATPATE